MTSLTRSGPYLIVVPKQAGFGLGVWEQRGRADRCAEMIDNQVPPDLNQRVRHIELQYSYTEYHITA